MARPINYSLTYFPLEVNMKDDPKILLAEEYVAEELENDPDKVYSVACKLLSWIYGRDGYYIKWHNELAVTFSKKECRNTNAQLVIDIVNKLIDLDFFNKEMYEEHQILTSWGIQKRWRFIITQTRRKAKIKKKYEINASDDELTHEETTGKQILTTGNNTRSTQRKGKEKKGNEINNNKAGQGGLVQEEKNNAGENSVPAQNFSGVDRMVYEDEDKVIHPAEKAISLFKQGDRYKQIRYNAATSNSIFKPGTNEIDYALFFKWVDCWSRWKIHKQRVKRMSVEMVCQHFPRWLNKKETAGVNPDLENLHKGSDTASTIPDSNDPDKLKDFYSDK